MAEASSRSEWRNVGVTYHFISNSDENDNDDDDYLYSKKI